MEEELWIKNLIEFYEREIDAIRDEIDRRKGNIEFEQRMITSADLREIEMENTLKSLKLILTDPQGNWIPGITHHEEKAVKLGFRKGGDIDGILTKEPQESVVDC